MKCKGALAWKYIIYYKDNAESYIFCVNLIIHIFVILTLKKFAGIRLLRIHQTQSTIYDL